MITTSIRLKTQNCATFTVLIDLMVCVDSPHSNQLNGVKVEGVVLHVVYIVKPFGTGFVIWVIEIDVTVN